MLSNLQETSTGNCNNDDDGGAIQDTYPDTADTTDGTVDPLDDNEAVGGAPRSAPVGPPSEAAPSPRSYGANYIYGPRTSSREKFTLQYPRYSSNTDRIFGTFANSKSCKKENDNPNDLAEEYQNSVSRTEVASYSTKWRPNRDVPDDSVCTRPDRRRRTKVFKSPKGK